MASVKRLNDDCDKNGGYDVQDVSANSSWLFPALGSLIAVVGGGILLEVLLSPFKRIRHLEQRIEKQMVPRTEVEKRFEQIHLEMGTMRQETKNMFLEVREAQKQQSVDQAESLREITGDLKKVLAAVAKQEGREEERNKATGQ